MFRRVEDTLEPDPTFPADLKQLGFFLNIAGQVRMINAPEKPYIFRATNNERVNEVLREAMQTCLREEVEKRLCALDIGCIYLPGFTTTKPTIPHVPILSPPPEILKEQKRIIVIVNDALQDLGILAYRSLQQDLGVNGGSVVNFVKEMIERSHAEKTSEQHKKIITDKFRLNDNENPPGLIVLNTGQLLYSHKHNRAMTLRSWSAMPRKSAVHDMVRIHEDENHVPGHRNPKEHVKTVFDELLCNPTRVAPDAEVYVVAIEDGTASVLDLLAKDFDKYGARITAMALIHSTVDDSQIHHPGLRAFLHQRTRQWIYSSTTPDPSQCVDLPTDYAKAPQSSIPRDTPAITKSAKHISWNELLPASECITAIANALQRSTITAPLPHGEKVSWEASSENMEWASGQVVVCPTFAGGKDAVAECVFTNPTVQRAILSFFEEVAQDPEHYSNPNLKLYTEAPKPSPNDPLDLSVDSIVTSLSPPPSEMTPEHAELDHAQNTLSHLRIALAACPTDVPELAPGRARLAHKIEAQKREIASLEKKALASATDDLLRASEAANPHPQRENWKPQVEGPKVPFAGTLVDCEMLKAAGLYESADAELEKKP